MIQNPRALLEGLQESQDEATQENKVLIERLEMIKKQIEKQDNQLNKLLDLYLTGDFPREMPTERKTRLRKT